MPTTLATEFGEALASKQYATKIAFLQSTVIWREPFRFGTVAPGGKRKMEIINPVVNGGWVDVKVLREQANERSLQLGVEQRRDDQGRFRSFGEVPTNVAEEGAGC